MRQKLLKIFIYSALGIISIGVAIFVYWNLQPNDVLTIRGPITVKPVVAKGEGAVTLHFNFCKNMDVEGKVQQSFVSNKTELLSPGILDRGPKACYKDQAVTILIPPQTLPDRYRIKYTVTYQVNPITTTVETFESEPFDVVSQDTVLPFPYPTSCRTILISIISPSRSLRRVPTAKARRITLASPKLPGLGPFRASPRRQARRLLQLPRILRSRPSGRAWSSRSSI
jgi:hypothetical protein